jgi:hypothetical protein
MGGKCNECSGLRMQVGRLKKQLEQVDKKDIPDLRPYISKVDVLKNLVDEGDLEAVKDRLYLEINNLKTIFEKLIKDFT